MDIITILAHLHSDPDAWLWVGELDSYEDLHTVAVGDIVIYCFYCNSCARNLHERLLTSGRAVKPSKVVECQICKLKPF